MFINRTFSTFLLSTIVYHCAYANKLPHGCEVTGFGYNGTHLVVNENGDQAFYLIQNRSLQTIKLQRIESKDVFMSPPLLAKLDPGLWGAFASDIENLHFQCFYVTPPNTNDATNNTIPNNQNVDCRDVLDVCQYPRVKFALSNMGNYWVSSNKSQQDVIKDATSKGIYLRW